MVCSETPSRCKGADRLANMETCVAYDRGMVQQVIVQLAHLEHLAACKPAICANHERARGAA